MKSLNVAVLGASPKPDRYSNQAMRMLAKHGHRPIPINPAFDEILGERCYGHLADISEKIDTITLYLSPKRSAPLIDEIIEANPRRIILNPGTESDLLEERAREAGIEVVSGCTLVMLRSGEF